VSTERLLISPNGRRCLLQRIVYCSHIKLFSNLGIGGPLNVDGPGCSPVSTPLICHWLLPKRKSPRWEPNQKRFAQHTWNISGRLQGLWSLSDKLSILFEPRNACCIRSHCHCVNKLRLCKYASRTLMSALNCCPRFHIFTNTALCHTGATSSEFSLDLMIFRLTCWSSDFSMQSNDFLQSVFWRI